MNYSQYLNKSTVGEGISSNTIKLALIKYCRDNPIKDTADATEDVYYQLYNDLSK